MLHTDDRRGGVVIAVKTSISHYRVEMSPLANIEATAVELLRVLGGLFLVLAFKPPSSALLHNQAIRL